MYCAEKSKFNSIVEHQYKFAHNWKCFYRDEEIFTLAPKPRIQTASRAVKTNHLTSYKDDQIVRVWGKQHCPSIFKHVQAYLMK